MWEYETVLWPPGSTWKGETGRAGLAAMLSGKGVEGWELVTVFDELFVIGKPGPSHPRYFIFKRPKVVTD